MGVPKKGKSSSKGKGGGKGKDGKGGNVKRTNSNHQVC